MLKLSEERSSKVYVTTVCKVRNHFGRFYLFLIAPFHKYSVKRLIANAATVYEYVVESASPMSL